MNKFIQHSLVLILLWLPFVAFAVISMPDAVIKNRSCKNITDLIVKAENAGQKIDLSKNSPEAVKIWETKLIQCFANLKKPEKEKLILGVEKSSVPKQLGVTSQDIAKNIVAEAVVLPAFKKGVDQALAVQQVVETIVAALPLKQGVTASQAAQEVQQFFDQYKAKKIVQEPSIDEVGDVLAGLNKVGNVPDAFLPQVEPPADFEVSLPLIFTPESTGSPDLPPPPSVVVGGFEGVPLSTELSDMPPPGAESEFAVPLSDDEFIKTDIDITDLLGEGIAIDKLSELHAAAKDGKLNPQEKAAWLKLRRKIALSQEEKDLLKNFLPELPAPADEFEFELPLSDEDLIKSDEFDANELAKESGLTIPQIFKLHFAAKANKLQQPTSGAWLKLRRLKLGETLTDSEKLLLKNYGPSTKPTMSEAAAATKIQKIFRGHKVRKEFKELIKIKRYLAFLHDPFKAPALKQQELADFLETIKKIAAADVRNSTDNILGEIGYKNLARKWHPDKSLIPLAKLYPGVPEKDLKELANAVFDTINSCKDIVVIKIPSPWQVPNKKINEDFIRAFLNQMKGVAAKVQAGQIQSGGGAERINLTNLFSDKVENFDKKNDLFFLVELSSIAGEMFAREEQKMTEDEWRMNLDYWADINGVEPSKFFKDPAGFDFADFVAKVIKVAKEFNLVKPGKVQTTQETAMPDLPPPSLALTDKEIQALATAIGLQVGDTVETIKGKIKAKYPLVSDDWAAERAKKLLLLVPKKEAPALLSDDEFIQTDIDFADLMGEGIAQDKIAELHAAAKAGKLNPQEKAAWLKLRREQSLTEADKNVLRNFLPELPPPSEVLPEPWEVPGQKISKEFLQAFFEKMKVVQQSGDVANKDALKKSFIDKFNSTDVQFQTFLTVAANGLVRIASTDSKNLMTEEEIKKTLNPQVIGLQNLRPSEFLKITGFDFSDYENKVVEIAKQSGLVKKSMSSSASGSSVLPPLWQEPGAKISEEFIKAYIQALLKVKDKGVPAQKAELGRLKPLYQAMYGTYPIPSFEIYMTYALNEQIPFLVFLKQNLTAQDIKNLLSEKDFVNNQTYAQFFADTLFNIQDFVDKVIKVARDLNIIELFGGKAIEEINKLSVDDLDQFKALPADVREALKKKFKRVGGQTDEAYARGIANKGLIPLENETEGGYARRIEEITGVPNIKPQVAIGPRIGGSKKAQSTIDYGGLSKENFDFLNGTDIQNKLKLQGFAEEKAAWQKVVDNPEKSLDDLNKRLLNDFVFIQKPLTYVPIGVLTEEQVKLLDSRAKGGELEGDEKKSWVTILKNLPDFQAALAAGEVSKKQSGILTLIKGQAQELADYLTAHELSEQEKKEIGVLTSDPNKKELRTNVLKVVEMILNAGEQAQYKPEELIRVWEILRIIALRQKTKNEKLLGAVLLKLVRQPTSELNDIEKQLIRKNAAGASTAEALGKTIKTGQTVAVLTEKQEAALNAVQDSVKAAIEKITTSVEPTATWEFLKAEAMKSTGLKLGQLLLRLIGEKRGLLIESGLTDEDKELIESTVEFARPETPKKQEPKAEPKKPEMQKPEPKKSEPKVQGPTIYELTQAEKDILKQGLDQGEIQAVDAKLYSIGVPGTWRYATLINKVGPDGKSENYALVELQKILAHLIERKDFRPGDEDFLWIQTSYPKMPTSNLDKFYKQQKNDGVVQSSDEIRPLWLEYLKTKDKDSFDEMKKDLLRAFDKALKQDNNVKVNQIKIVQSLQKKCDLKYLESVVDALIKYKQAKDTEIKKAALAAGKSFNILDFSQELDRINRVIGKQIRGESEEELCKSLNPDYSEAW